MVVHPPLEATWCESAALLDAFEQTHVISKQNHFVSK